MTGRSRGFLLLLGFLLVSGEAGCSKRVVEEQPTPVHPFPSWVGELETG